MKPFIDDPCPTYGAGRNEDIALFVDVKRPVEVYLNLHKNCFSVRQNGIVQLHTNYILLRDVNFVVNLTGRARVLRERRKNVHAFVRGYFCTSRDTFQDLDFHWPTVTYNPYHNYSFMAMDRGEKWAVSHARFVDMAMENDGDEIYPNILAGFPE